MMLSVQTSTPAEWGCLHPGCKQKPFKRHADLERHIKHVHQTSSDEHYCDYRKCPRSKLSPTKEDDSTIPHPFSRRDHLKAHLREYHMEPLLKRNGKENSSFFDDRIFNPTWWRCSKCLDKNHVSRVGYKCSNCAQSLEASVVEQRQRRFPNGRAGEARRHR